MNGTQRLRFFGTLILVFSFFSWGAFVVADSYHFKRMSSPKSSDTRETDWENVWDDSFVLSEIWGDDSNLYTGAEYTMYGHHEILIQKWGNDGTLLKNYSWNPPFDNVALTGIWGNAESVCISGYVYEIVEEGEVTYITGYGYITKFDKNLEFIWTRTLNTSSISDIWCNEDHFFTAGSTRVDNSTLGLLLAKWDMNGQQIWNTTDIIDSGYYQRSLHIMGNSNSLYTNYMQYCRSNFSETLIKWNLDGTRIWNQTNANNDTNFNDFEREFWVGEEYIFQMHEETYMGPTLSYIKEKTAIRTWDTEGDLIWERSKDFYLQYAEGSGFPVSQIWSNGSGMYLCTDNRSGSYPSTDLLLRHYHDNGTINWERVWNRGGRDIQVYSILLWGDNESFYVGGQIRDLAPFNLNFLIKWNIMPYESTRDNKIPGYPLYLLISLIGICVFIIIKQKKA